MTPAAPHPAATPLLPGSRRLQRRVQLADPAVSRAKFDWEVTHFRESEQAHRGRGIILIRAEFPTVLFAFAATRIHPTPVVFGSLLDYTDYDHSPPSLRLVDPFTERLYRTEELPPALLRRILTLGQPSGDARFEVRRLVQSREGSLPSVCVPGTREYYGQPGIGRDAWLLDRHNDVGSLASLIEQLYAYALAAFDDPNPERALAHAVASASASDDQLLGETSRPDPGPRPR